MISLTVSNPLPGDVCEPADIDPSAEGRRAGHGMAERKWLTLGIAAALGFVAGSTLFATEAQGRHAARQRSVRRG